MRQENELAKAALEESTELSKIESGELRAKIELDKQAAAARVMQYCMNRICSLKYVEAWERWVKVHKAMVRAGRIMQRVMCKFANNQTMMGWDRWVEALYAEQQAAAIMNRCLTHIESHHQAQVFDTWVDGVAKSRRLERSQTTEENAAAKLQALERAHVQQLEALQLAQEEAKSNELVLKAFYKKYSPEKLTEYLQVLEAYTLEQIVGLAMMRYDEVPEFYSGGKLVVGEVSDEMAENQKARLEEEKAEEEIQANVQADASKHLAALELAREELVRMTQEQEQVLILKSQQMLQKIEDHEIALVRLEEDAQARILALERAHAKQLSELKLTQEERAHNEAALTAFYQKHNPARVPDVISVLQRYELRDLVTLSVLRYQDNPNFLSGGEPVTPVITDEMAHVVSLSPPVSPSTLVSEPSRQSVAERVAHLERAQEEVEEAETDQAEEAEEATEAEETAEMLEAAAQVREEELRREAAEQAGRTTDEEAPAAGAHSSCTIQIATGSLGINVYETSAEASAFSVTFNLFTRVSSAADQAAGRLVKGMVLTHINGACQRGRRHAWVLETLGERPCEMVWERAEETVQAEVTEQATEKEQEDQEEQEGQGGQEVEALTLEEAVKLFTQEEEAQEEQAQEEQEEQEEQEDCNDEVGILIEIDNGALGINVYETPDAVRWSAYSVTFNQFTDEGSSATDQAAGRLVKGMVLTHINGACQRGRSHARVLKSLKRRPCEMEWCDKSLRAGWVPIPEPSSPTDGASLLRRAKGERERNRNALETFYQEHNPERVEAASKMLDHYSLERLAGLALVRYGVAPLLYSNGKPVEGQITPAEGAEQRQKMKTEQQQIAKAK
jgi:hypothetical protein